MTARALAGLALTAIAACGGDAGDAPIDGPGAIDAVSWIGPAASAGAGAHGAVGPPLPRPVHHANAAVVGDAIYVVGAVSG